MAHLFPGLHPDGFEAADSGWPRGLQRIAAEAWRRAEAGELTDQELYCSDATWCGKSYYGLKEYDNALESVEEAIERDKNFREALELRNSIKNDMDKEK